jgi:ariadne-1
VSVTLGKVPESGSEEAAADVAEVLSIPSSLAAVLLWHFKWRTSRVKDEWFSNDRRVRDAVGLPADGAPVPMALSRRELVCVICFGRFGAGETRSAGCAH